MEIAEFRQDMMESIRTSAEIKKDFVRACYVEDVGTRLTDAEEIFDFQVCHFEGFGTRKRHLQVDGYSLDDVDGSLTLLIANFSNEDELQAFGATEARRSFSMLKAFIEDSISGNLTNGTIEESLPGYGLAADIVRLQASIVRFRLYLASDSQFNSRTHEWPEEEIAGIPVEFHIWDVVRFHRAHESASGRVELEVDFCNSDGSGLPALEVGTGNGEYQAYLCMITGDVLAGIYERHGSRLLEGNVRSFLSAKGKINAGIQTTIQEKPEMFFAYNNGIAATAEAIMVENCGSLKITKAVNFQIVNGGQTTASLATAARNGVNLSKVCVQVKLSVLPPAKAGELIPLIARFANSQNKVSNADFFANHPYHIRMEEISRRIWTPAVQGAQHGTHWFYERSRGQYLNEQVRLSGTRKAQFLAQNPKIQLLVKTYVAKLENTWRGFPHKVSLGDQKNFLIFAEWAAKKWLEDEKIFNEVYFRDLIAKAILFRHTETLVKQQAWYKGSYRPNLVTYSLAMLQYIILKNGKGCQLDLRGIWATQAVSLEVSEQIALIAKFALGILTDTNRSKENVTEWAKAETCWERLKEVAIPLNKAVLAQLADPLADSEHGAVQSIGYGVFAKTAVMAVPVYQWEEMRNWGAERNILTIRESDLLRAASRIPQFSPAAKDCEKILGIRSKLVGKGFEVSGPPSPPS